MIDVSAQWSDASDLLGGLGDHQTALGLSLGANALYRMSPQACVLEPAPLQEVVHELGVVSTGLSVAVAQLRNSSRNIGATQLADILDDAEHSLFSASTILFEASNKRDDCLTFSIVASASTDLLNAGGNIMDAAEEIAGDSTRHGWWPWVDVCTCGKVKRGDGLGGKVQKVCLLRQGILCGYCDWATSDSDILWSLIWTGATE